jgi:hypothetical protein
VLHRSFSWALRQSTIDLEHGLVEVAEPVRVVHPAPCPGASPETIEQPPRDVPRPGKTQIRGDSGRVEGGRQRPRRRVVVAGIAAYPVVEGRPG